MSAPPADPSAKPTVYLLYGDDALAIEDAIHSLLDQFPDSTTAEMNLTRFDGAAMNLGQLEEVAQSAPFLADRRLVIVENAAKLSSHQADADGLFQLLSSLPATTALILVDAGDFNKDQSGDRYRKRSPLHHWVRDNPETSFERFFRLPQGNAFVTWLRQECQSLGAEIELPAAQLLAEYVADDSYLARSELQKLISFVDSERPIRAEDVEQLTPLYGQADIFEMVDALGTRQVDLALRLLQQLLQSHDARYAFAMVVRQARLLILARAALDAGQDPSASLSLHPYVARKVGEQARNFQMERLERLHSELLQLDLASKSSRADLVTGMFQLLADLAPVTG